MNIHSDFFCYITNIFRDDLLIGIFLLFIYIKILTDTYQNSIKQSPQCLKPGVVFSVTKARRPGIVFVNMTKFPHRVKLHPRMLYNMFLM